MGLEPHGPSPIKSQPQGAFGGASSADDRLLFGTQAEINNRVGTGYALGGTNPASLAPSFSQIRTEVSGRNMNMPSIDERRGDLKFGDNRRFF